jgi:type VI secretion system protein VasD
MRVLAGAAVCALALGLVACGGSAPPKPTPTKASLVVAGDVNPDASGRASPVVVRLYQLKEEGEFDNAAFFALFDKEQETLGASLISREEYELKPGDTRTLELKIAPEAHYLGAIAGYRDINNAKWKSLLPAGQKLKTVTINVGKSEIAVVAGK